MPFWSIYLAILIIASGTRTIFLSLSLSFPICKMEIIMFPVTQVMKINLVIHVKCSAQCLGQPALGSLVVEHVIISCIIRFMCYCQGSFLETELILIFRFQCLNPRRNANILVFKPQKRSCPVYLCVPHSAWIMILNICFFN